MIGSIGMLAGLFALVALFYASIGFGGGSSYLALLVLWNIPYAAIPVIALMCNIVVVAGNSFHYVRAGHLRLQLLWPLAVTSIPLSYVGGRMILSKELFLLILCGTLLVSGVRLLLQHRTYGDDLKAYCAMPAWLGAGLGGGLGFLAGVTGIGGGIFLSPILYQLRVASPRQIATITSLFILLNSMAGIVGQLQKQGFSVALADYWLLPLMALMGGQVGNQLMLRWIKPHVTALLTALLVLFVAGQLALRLWSEG